MLIDRKRPDFKSHRRWMALTTLLVGLSLIIYFWERQTSPYGVLASNRVGLWFGVAATACMAFAGFLAYLRRIPTWWIVGSRQWWLKGHIYLGSLSLLLMFCHSGFRFGGPLEMVLCIVVIAVVVSGVVGLLLQQWLPNALTGRVPSEVPYEQVRYQCQLLRKKADALVDALCGPEVEVETETMVRKSPMSNAATRAALRKAYEDVIRPFLDPEFAKPSPLERPAQAETFFRTLRAVPGMETFVDVTPLAVLTKEDKDREKDGLRYLERYCADRRLMSEQERLHLLMHLWLLVHIPLSALLLGLIVAHVVTATYF